MSSETDEIVTLQWNAKCAALQRPGYAHTPVHCLAHLRRQKRASHSPHSSLSLQFRLLRRRCVAENDHQLVIAIAVMRRAGHVTSFPWPYFVRTEKRINFSNKFDPR